MQPILNLFDLLAHEVDDLYSAEEQIIEALPKMAKKATDKELKKSLNEHLDVTKGQKSRLDKVKSLLAEKKVEPEKKGFLERIFGSSTKCKGTQGLIEEAEKLMNEKLDPKVMDAAIIASAQKIEHYEIAGYGTAKAYARELALSQVEKLLDATLQEEYKADQALTSLATSKVNIEAEVAASKPRVITSGKTTRPTAGTASKPSARHLSTAKKTKPAKKSFPKAGNKAIHKKTS